MYMYHSQQQSYSLAEGSPVHLSACRPSLSRRINGPVAITLPTDCDANQDAERNQLYPEKFLGFHSGLYRTRASAHRRPPRILGTSDSPAPCAPQNRDATILLLATPSPWILPGMTKWTRSPQALTAPESRPILPMPKHTRGPDQTRRNALVPCSHYQRFPP